LNGPVNHHQKRLQEPLVGSFSHLPPVAVFHTHIPLIEKFIAYTALRKQRSIRR